MSAQHTPGPWVAFGLVTPGPKEQIGYWCRGPGAWVCVADCSHVKTGNGGAPGELEANARLIAAAPELLAALRDLVDTYELIADCEASQAREAIAKATEVQS